MTLLSASCCPYSVRCVSLNQSVTINSALLKGFSMGPFFFAQCEITTKAVGGPNLAHVLYNMMEFYEWPVTEIIKCIQHQNEAVVHFEPVSSVNLFSTTSLSHSKCAISRVCEMFREEFNCNPMRSHYPRFVWVDGHSRSTVCIWSCSFHHSWPVQHLASQLGVCAAISTLTVVVCSLYGYIQGPA